MRILIAILLLTSFELCPPPPIVPPVDPVQALRDSLRGKIDSVEIGYLRIGLLKGMPSESDADAFITDLPFETVTIDLDEEFDLNNGVLSIEISRIDSLTLKEGMGETREKTSYRIGALRFNQIVFKKDDQIVAVYDKPVRVVDFRVDQYYVLTADDFSNGVLTKVNDLKSRIARLLELIDAVTKVEPDHAARELPPSLHRLDKILDEMRTKYQNNSLRLITPHMRADKGRLSQMEITVSRLEAEVEDPLNKPIKIENELLFETGEFDITRSREKLDEITFQILKKAANLQSRYPDMPVKIALAVTGYADEQKVEFIKDTLLTMYANTEYYNPGKDKTDQALLNLLLSQARADNMFSYLKAGVEESGIPATISFIDKGSEGKGWAYPPRVPYPCKNNCQARRVVYISHIVFPEEEPGG